MSDILEEGDDAATAAISYTDEFLDAAVTSIDRQFGDGYAKANPVLTGALVQASAANLNAFMMAATSASNGLMDMFQQASIEALGNPNSASGKRKK